MDALKKYLLLAALGAGAVAALVYFGKKGMTAAGQVASTALNPYSSQNLLYNNVIGGAGQALTGDQGFSLGTWVYDLTHKTDLPTKASPLQKAAKK